MTAFVRVVTESVVVLGCASGPLGSFSTPVTDAVFVRVTAPATFWSMRAPTVITMVSFGFNTAGPDAVPRGTCQVNRRPVPASTVGASVVAGPPATDTVGRVVGSYDMPTGS